MLSRHHSSNKLDWLGPVGTTITETSSCRRPRRLYLTRQLPGSTAGMSRRRHANNRPLSSEDKTTATCRRESLSVQFVLTCSWRQETTAATDEHMKPQLVSAERRRPRGRSAARSHRENKQEAERRRLRELVIIRFMTQSKLLKTD